MRTLNLDEFVVELRKHIEKIEYCEPRDSTILIDQLFFFLHDQPISRRILSRISEDFTEMGHSLKNVEINPDYNDKKVIKESLKSSELQGVFAFNILDRLYSSTSRKHDSYYIQLGHTWFDGGGDYYDWQRKFNTFFLEPFNKLLAWYCYESRPKSDADYFSYESKNDISTKLDEIIIQLTNQGFANEIIFNEIGELEETMIFLKKKSWLQLMDAKLSSIGASMIPEEKVNELRIMITDFITNPPNNPF
jgi:hypothetical protein